LLSTSELLLVVTLLFQPAEGKSHPLDQFCGGISLVS